jgi:pSer/pThr/pTyr-binding forkhead associated (FHA) protein
MAKLVVLTQSMAGRSCDLIAERTTVGRVEDNTFQIAEPSVSSRHCEILLQGSDILIKDLGSTNGTFINGEKITEGVLKPGQTLKLGNVELKLDVPGATASAPAASSAAPAPAAPPKKEPVKAPVGGISTSQLETGGRGPNFDTSTAFTKKKKGSALIFWVSMGVVLLIIIVLIIIAIAKAAH